jgi:hypothetical protein
MRARTCACACVRACMCMCVRVHAGVCPYASVCMHACIWVQYNNSNSTKKQEKSREEAVLPMPIMRKRSETTLIEGYKIRRGTMPKPCRMTKLMKKFEAEGSAVPMAVSASLIWPSRKMVVRRDSEPPSIPPRNTLNTFQKKYREATRRSMPLSDTDRPSISAKLHPGRPVGHSLSSSVSNSLRVSQSYSRSTSQFGSRASRQAVKESISSPVPHSYT